MSAPFEDRDRQVIPRWRRFVVSTAMGELGAANIPGQQNQEDSKGGFDLAAKTDQWKSTKSLATAAELVEAALVAGSIVDEAEAARSFLAARGDELPTELRRISSRALSDGATVTDDHDISNIIELYNYIARLKRILFKYPRSAIHYVDIARAYASLGDKDRATHHLKIALSLAPENRFVLRAANRLFINNDQFELAHRVLLNSPATDSDPWLLSAEISSAEILGKTSTLVRRARAIVANDGFSSHARAELASALGTLEGKRGSHRKARALFDQSIIRPTDNSIAQLEWATRNISSLTLPEELLQRPYTYEARTKHSYWDSKWSNAFYQAKRWLEDEPYSSKPASAASFISAVCLQDYDSSIQLLKLALRANPASFALLNNIAYDYAKMGMEKEAMSYLNKIETHQLQPGEQIALAATIGLVEFRSGNVEAGNVGYRAAADAARRTGDAEREALACIEHAHESYLSKQPEISQLLAIAKEVQKKTSDPGVRRRFSLVEKEIMSEQGIAGVEAG